MAGLSTLPQLGRTRAADRVAGAEQQLCALMAPLTASDDAVVARELLRSFVGDLQSGRARAVRIADGR
jgi:hypothetical protein